MPYISTKATVGISPEKEKILKAKLGEAIGILRGKSERWLMLSFEDGCRMWFAGDDAPCAMIEVKLFGKADRGELEKLTAKITEIISGELGIGSDRIYIKYEECDSWGWSGSNF